ncbi:uncharacterized protein LOC106012254 [Aplysia californica]|uniref:Uncharacterized protein LOC106012254 n=1 Tax=Aplysia californica TaxID=6500 RepID=A0ABM1A3H7_APLCA|nr:uncharacterized protein LOC106012254 [Aplysia californica]
MLRNIWKLKTVLSVCAHCVIVSVLLLWHCTTPANGLDNVALGKPAEKTEYPYTYNGLYLARFAIDGNNDTNVDNCSFSGYIMNRHLWWMVDLLQTFLVHSVQITSASYNFGLSPDEIILKNSSVYVAEGNPQNDPEFPNENSLGKLCVRVETEIGRRKTVLQPCVSPVSGRFVTVYRSKWDLILCEVEVFAQAVNASSSTVQFSMDISKGRKSLQAPPLFSRQGVRSLLECATVCVGKKGERGEVCNSLHYQRSTRDCECLQLSDLHSYKEKQEPNSRWTLATLNNGGN